MATEAEAWAAKTSLIAIGLASRHRATNRFANSREPLVEIRLLWSPTFTAI